MIAEPASCMIVRTSAKSVLISPGMLMRSVMPFTPCNRMLSAILKASTIVVFESAIVSSRSFGMTISVSTCSRSRSIPCSACIARRRPFEGERLRDDRHGERAEIARDLGDDRRAAGAGAAALARGDEHHVGALQDLADLLGVVERGGAADLRVAPGPEAAGQLAADVELEVGLAEQQRLRVRVDGDELDAAQLGVDHAVHGVHAAAADPDHLDDGDETLSCLGHLRRCLPATNHARVRRLLPPTTTQKSRIPSSVVPRPIPRRPICRHCPPARPPADPTSGHRSVSGMREPGRP